ncbi:Transmembrane and coiled-coil domain-containing protein 4, partial [Coemansia sp. RSA 2049]
RDIMGLDLGDAYTMYFETKELAALQGALSEFVGSTAKSMALSLVLKQTVLSGLIGAFTWPLALLNLAKLIDAPWSVGLERAKRAGKLLADILESRAHGKRPPLMRRKLVNLDLASIVVQHADYLDKIDDITLEVSRVL